MWAVDNDKDQIAYLPKGDAAKGRILGRTVNGKVDAQTQMWIGLVDLLVKYPGGDVSMVRPDGTVLPPFDGGKSIVAPWDSNVRGGVIWTRDVSHG